MRAAARKMSLLAGLVALLAVHELAHVRMAHAYCMFNGGTKAFTFYQQPVMASGFKVALNPGEWACCGWYNNDCNGNDGACGITGFGVNEGYDNVDSVTRGIIAKEVFTYLSYALTAPFMLPFFEFEIPMLSLEAVMSTVGSTAWKIGKSVEDITEGLSELGHAASASEFASLAAEKGVTVLSALVEGSINKAISQVFGISGASDIARVAFRELGFEIRDTASAVDVAESSLTAVEGTEEATASNGFFSKVKAAYSQGKAAVDSLQASVGPTAEQLARSAGIPESRIAQFKSAAQSYLDASDRWYSVSDQFNTIRYQINNAKRGWSQHTNQTNRGTDNTQANTAARQPGVNSQWTDYATQTSEKYSGGTLQVPNAGFITIDSSNTIQWCWQVYSCDGKRDFMAESGVIYGQTDIDSRGGGHKFDRSCFLGCTMNGMDAFGNTDRPNYLYRRSSMGVFDHSRAPGGSNGCCNVVLQSMQNSLSVQMDTLNANHNATTANINALKASYNSAIVTMKKAAPMCFMSEMTEYMGCYRDNGDTRALEHGAWGNDDIERCYDQTTDGRWFGSDGNTPRTPYTNYWTYFGVEDGGECYMGPRIVYRAGTTGFKLDSQWPPGPPSQCNRWCQPNLTIAQINVPDGNPDNHRETCGGAWALNIWRRRGTEEFSANYSYIGCYNDIPRSSDHDYHGSRGDINAPGDAYDSAATSLHPPMNHVLPIRATTRWKANFGAWNYVPSVQECADLAMDLGYKYFGLEVGDECWLSEWDEWDEPVGSQWAERVTRGC